MNDAPSDALVDLLSRWVTTNEQLLDELRSGRLTPRYLREGAAAIYCGFESAAKPDPKHKSFRRFCKEEGVRAKRGNGGRGYIFSVADLDKAMTSKLVSVTK